MKSYIAKPSDIDRKWYVIDAEGQTLGKLAVEAAMLLRGKKKPTYTPHIDTGDYVIVINAEKVAVSGKKESDKIYKRHTGYPGGLRETTLGEMRATKPEEIILHAVRGMMPKGRRENSDARCSRSSKYTQDLSIHIQLRSLKYGLGRKEE